MIHITSLVRSAQTPFTLLHLVTLSSILLAPRHLPDSSSGPSGGFLHPVRNCLDYAISLSIFFSTFFCSIFCKPFSSVLHYMSPFFIKHFSLLLYFVSILSLLLFPCTSPYFTFFRSLFFFLYFSFSFFLSFPCSLPSYHACSAHNHLSLRLSFTAQLFYSPD